MTKRTFVFLSLTGLVAFGRAPAPIAAPAQPETSNCEDYYEGNGRPRDFGKALACYRKREDWLWVALLQVNGEGTQVDLAGARASLDRLEFKDADAEALERIIKKHEANPTVKSPRVDFCEDVANTTPSIDICTSRKQTKKTAKSDGQLKKIGADLDPRVRPAFGRAWAAFDKFVKAEGARAYQESIDGTIRNQAAMDQEALARRNFIAAIRLVVMGPAARLAGRRSFSDADQELNVAYKDTVVSYVKFNEESQTRISDYKTKSRAAQHEWVRYRDAMGDLAAARWRDARDAREQARALVTEDRIRELRGK